MAWRITSGGPECNHTIYECTGCGALSQDMHEHGVGGYRMNRRYMRDSHVCVPDPPPLCTICREHHGREVEHPCE